MFPGLTVTLECIKLEDKYFEGHQTHERLVTMYFIQNLSSYLIVRPRITTLSAV
jgi:hypothetical protein